MGKYQAKAATAIKAPAEKIWEALTDPELIKKYLFGVDVTSDWKVGSSITYRGVWEGKPFEDKGKIVELEPNKTLKASYWTSFSGREDKPENYDMVTYELSEENGESMLTITQENNFSQEEVDRAAKNWASVLENIKKMLEK
jgi:uncharacterized protein YndB with AHSA1/START domain